VILNIRQIQESADDDKTLNLPGLQFLCIDFVERTMEEAHIRTHLYDDSSFCEHARRMAFFREFKLLRRLCYDEQEHSMLTYAPSDEPVWKLGSDYTFKAQVLLPRSSFLVESSQALEQNC
jgi:hypothetical protein